jgi:hypothetical protein
MTSKLRYRTDTAEALVRRLADILSVPDGEFTVNRLGQDIRGGHPVAINPDAQRLTSGRVTGEYVSAFIQDHARTLLSGPYVVNGRREPSTGVAVLSVCVLAPNLAEAHIWAELRGTAL